MRHLLANLVTYAIAAFLLIGAGLFAAARSAQLVVSDEATVLARYAPAPGHEFRWAVPGREGYRRNCGNCHGSEGGGWDQYPGLEHVGALFDAPGGKEYLIDLHLYGLASDRWRVPMPPMGHLGDLELAAVLNHVLTRLSDPATTTPAAQLYLPDDIAARRGRELSPRQVDRGRPPEPVR